MAANGVLGISLGTRAVGLAVIQDRELIEWKVKSFKEAWSEDKERLILTSILQVCAWYNVCRIIVKKVNPTHSSPQLDCLFTGLRRQVKRQRISIRFCSLSKLDYDAQKKKKTKRLLTAEMVKRHPELRSTYVKARINRQDYYTKMFEAVALAEYYSGQQI